MNPLTLYFEYETIIKKSWLCYEIYNMFKNLNYKKASETKCSHFLFLLFFFMIHVIFFQIMIICKLTIYLTISVCIVITLVFSWYAYFIYKISYSNYIDICFIIIQYIQTFNQNETFHVLTVYSFCIIIVFCIIKLYTNNYNYTCLPYWKTKTTFDHWPVELYNISFFFIHKVSSFSFIYISNI